MQQNQNFHGGPVGNGSPYYNPYYYEAHQRMIKKNEDKHNLKKLSLYAGAALLVYILLQFVFIFALQIFELTDLYTSNEYIQCALDIILSVFCMFLPFCLFGKKMHKISSAQEPLPLGKPVSLPLMALAIFAGMGICMVSNYVTSFITIFMGFFGLEPSSPELAMPTGVLGVALTVTRIAVVAAIVEELSFRGFVMGNLRRYGDGFAIFMSAFVFAAVHGNLIQTPFALIAGFGLGYLCVKTNTLWTGIIIHFLNNLISVSVTYLSDIMPEEDLNLIYGLLIYALIALGGICLAVFNVKTRNRPLRKNQTSLSLSERVRAFLFSPTMIIAMIYMLITTITYIKTTSS